MAYQMFQDDWLSVEVMMDEQFVSSGNFSNYSGNFSSPQIQHCGEYDNYALRTFIISGCLAPLVIVVGCVCNFVNILVFLDRSMRNSLVNWYLVGLSISDSLILVSSFFMLCFPPIADFTGEWTFVEASNYLMRWIYPIGLTAQTQSVWLTVFVAIHRCVGVCSPFRAQRIYTKGRVKVCLLTVTFCSVLYNIPRYLELDLVKCWSDYFNRELRSLETSPLRGQSAYQLYYMTISYMIIMFVVPISVLTYTNVMTILTVRQSYRNRKFFTNSPTTKKLSSCNNSSAPPTPIHPRTGSTLSSVKESQANASGTTLMLVGLVFVFLICNSFGFLTNILELIVKRHGNLISPNPLLTQTYSILVDISNFVVLINSSINISVYLGFSKRYRQTFQNIFAAEPSVTNHTTSVCITTNNQTPSVAL